MPLRIAAVSAVAAATLLGACASHAARTAPAAAAPPPSAATAVVRPSELSPDGVRLVQRSLVDRGFAVDATGQFDDRTESALMDFQRARGLPATGNLSPPTLDALGLDAREILAARGAPAGGDLGTGSREDDGDGAARP